MAEMFTAKQVQGLLQVDRSTVYRMAEAGRIPALKVGRQWRFPAEQVNAWLQEQHNSPPAGKPASPVVTPAPAENTLADLLPLDCVQLILDSFAEALGAMLVITDMDGKPITAVSNRCGLLATIMSDPEALQRCIQTWHDLAALISLEPHYQHSYLGLKCARSLIRVGLELKGMVVTGCLAPAGWPPSDAEIEQMAADFGLEPAVITNHIQDVFFLDPAQQARVLEFLPRVADIVAHIVAERMELVGRLQTIAALTTLD